MISGGSKKLRAVLAAGAVVGGLGLLNEPNEQDAINQLARSVQNTFQNIDVKVAQTPNSKSGSGQQYDRNTGNAFGSTSTYHSYTWDYCLKWVGTESCSKWLDPYVSSHGFGDDQSPLEGAVARKWEELKEVNKGQDGKFAIWEIATKDGASATDSSGRLNRSALTKWDLLPEVKEEVEKVGDETALRAIASTYDSTESDSNTMPTMENLRALAQSYTYMIRNNLVAKLGETRRMRDDIQMPGGEDYANCQSVIAEARLVATQGNTDQRIYNQAPLSIEARTYTLAERAALCEKMMNAPIYQANPEVRENNVVSGNAGKESYEEWKIRMNLASIDFAGADATKLSRPRDAVLTEEEQVSSYWEYDAGGANRRLVKSTVAEQLNEYNQQLENAAAQLKAMSGYNPFIVDVSNEIRANQIDPGSKNLMQINGLTREMRGELKKSNNPQVATPVPEVAEQSAAELVITAAK